MVGSLVVAMVAKHFGQMESKEPSPVDPMGVRDRLIVCHRSTSLLNALHARATLDSILFNFAQIRSRLMA